jgi:hypothetical protein
MYVHPFIFELVHPSIFLLSTLDPFRKAEEVLLVGTGKAGIEEDIRKG